MSYQDQLSPWVVYRLLPNCQRMMMERFRKRNDAEEYVKVICRMQPGEEFEIVFEVEPGQDPGIREGKTIEQIFQRFAAGAK